MSLYRSLQYRLGYTTGRAWAAKEPYGRVEAASRAARDIADRWQGEFRLGYADALYDALGREVAAR